MTPRSPDTCGVDGCGKSRHSVECPHLDAGIRRAVEILRAAGVETCESCEGGPGHAYPEPTVAFYGRGGAGWHALQVCIDYGLPVRYVRRVWTVLEHVPTGPIWEVVFRAKTPQVEAAAPHLDWLEGRRATDPRKDTQARAPKTRKSR